MTEVVVPADRAIGISLQCALSDGQQIVFQTHVAQETDKAVIDSLVDKLSDVAARQSAKLKLPELRKALEKETSEMQRMIDDRGRLDEARKAEWDASGRRGEFKLSAKDAQDRANSEVTEKRYRDLIARIQAQIAENEALVGK